MILVILIVIIIILAIITAIFAAVFEFLKTIWPIVVGVICLIVVIIVVVKLMEVKDKRYSRYLDKKYRDVPPDGGYPSDASPGGNASNTNANDNAQPGGKKGDKDEYHNRRH